MEWSWGAWLISVAAVIASGLLAWREGSWIRPGVDLGFVNHGGMWGDLILLPIANAVIAPHLVVGWWLPGAIGISSLGSAAVHWHWYRGSRAIHSREHMWPSRTYRVWWRDLSLAGWAHVVYVIGELSLLIGFLLFLMPTTVIALVTVILTLHVPLGLLQPRWFLTGRLVSPRRQPLLLPCLVAVWLVAFVKM